MSDIKAVQLLGGTPVTPDDDNNDPAGPFDAFQATTAEGLVKLHTYNGDDVTMYAILGRMYFVKFTRVWSTGTAATGVLGFTQQNRQVAYP